MVISLERGADLHMAELMPLSLALVKSRLVLPFWYRLTRVVPDNGPLNGCVCVCVLVKLVKFCLFFHFFRLPITESVNKDYHKYLIS